MTTRTSGFYSQKDGKLLERYQKGRAILDSLKNKFTEKDRDEFASLFRPVNWEKIIVEDENGKQNKLSIEDIEKKFDIKWCEFFVPTDEKTAEEILKFYDREKSKVLGTLCLCGASYAPPFKLKYMGCAGYGLCTTESIVAGKLGERIGSLYSGELLETPKARNLSN